MTPLPDCMAIGDSTATCAIHFSGRGNYISDNHIAATTEAFEQADAMGFCFSMQVIGKNAGQIIERITDTPPEEKVWQHVHNCADIHGYRAEYATAIYKAHARAIEEIPYDRVNRGTGRRYQSEVYTCRKDEAGKKLDKAAMLICSKALGHNRISVVADNYIRGL